jgi:hypothetical protein
MSVRLNHEAGQMRERERYIQQLLKDTNLGVTYRGALDVLHHQVPPPYHSDCPTTQVPNTGVCRYISPRPPW